MLRTVAAALAAAAPVAADCVPPTIEHDTGRVARGDTITVSGESFGTACHDTGFRPDGEGVLGRPRRGIDVVIVQGGTEIVVARGSADDDDRFTVDITVPAALGPGEAEVVVRAGDAFVDDVTPEALVVSGAAPGGPTSVVTFGPGPDDTRSTGESSRRWWLAGLGVACAAAAGVGSALVHRRWHRG